MAVSAKGQSAEFSSRLRRPAAQSRSRATLASARLRVITLRTQLQSRVSHGLVYPPHRRPWRQPDRSCRRRALAGQWPHRRHLRHFRPAAAARPDRGLAPGVPRRPGDRAPLPPQNCCPASASAAIEPADWSRRPPAWGIPTPVWLAIAGLLTGIGTKIGNGCTSGHGVCGLARLSLRSLVAVVVFFGVAIITVAVTGVV